MIESDLRLLVSMTTHPSYGPFQSKQEGRINVGFRNIHDQKKVSLCC